MRLAAIPRVPLRTPPRLRPVFSPEAAERARAFHRTLPGYAPTPLIELPGLAAALGIRRLWVKDESQRFGLNAFKALGGSYAMHALLAGSGQERTFVTATDGNHGRGVAWAAGVLGQRAVVYLPAGSSVERLSHIRALGAEAEITSLGYDNCVRFAARQAQSHGWTLLQDTSWPGYERIPALIMQGYTTMGAEIAEQLEEACPTHLFLQAGVGAMAGAMAGFFAARYGAHRPITVIVEPDGADCLFRTAQVGDGALHACRNLRTMMAGLSCGEPCTLGWESLRRCADFALTCPDAVTAAAMRQLAHPCPGDRAIVSGESGAAGVGALMELLRGQAPALREVLGLDETAAVLCLNTEGDTDHSLYLRIVEGGENGPF